MKLSEITRTLREINVTPVKSLGQNFLHDQNLARWTIDHAQIAPGDYVVEIGPGLGALTEIILARGVKVLALEKDARLAKYLSEKFDTGELEILHTDALKFDVRTLYRKPRVKLLGNLPYYVSSQLLFKFVNYPSPISLWLLMLQKEMAQRLSASPSTPDYGALTLQIQLHHHVEYLRAVPASVFLPRPEVDSALVRITPRAPAELPAVDSALFSDLVRRGFSQRRKQLRKLLSDQVPDWEAAARSVGLDPKVRGEAMSLQEWIALTNYVRPIQPPSVRDEAPERFPVVDAEDRVLREAFRADVHGDNLLHRAVHVLIFNKNGEILLQKRSRWKDRHPMRWDSSAAGHVSAGEDYDVAARRELEEELGIETRLERVEKLPASKKTDQEFIWIYRGQYDGELRTDPGEIEAVGFFPAEMVDEWIETRPDDFATAFSQCWRAVCQRASASPARQA